jgi:NAD(P)-dependent dehydrogenase (short-subunit alcohol dehydrogenase family)
MDLKLKGRVALVTGAGSQSGYGRKIAVVLADEGCIAVAADIDFDGAKQTASEILARGGQAMAVAVDVAKRNMVDRMIDVVQEKCGRIDILVNNAGTSSRLKPFVAMTPSDWEVDIGVNLIGQMHVAQAVLPGMLSRKYGRIINTSGGQGIANISIYGAAKAGVEAFTHALAMEVGPSGIVVNGVGPGLGKTGLTANAPDEFLEAHARSTAFGRLCTPEDVAPVVAFLASDLCSYMAGQFITLSTS